LGSREHAAQLPRRLEERAEDLAVACAPFLAILAGGGEEERSGSALRSSRRSEGIGRKQPGDAEHALALAASPDAALALDVGDHLAYPGVVLLGWPMLVAG
jgi:hypothetical protein